MNVFFTLKAGMILPVMHESKKCGWIYFQVTKCSAAQSTKFWRLSDLKSTFSILKTDKFAFAGCKLQVLTVDSVVASFVYVFLVHMKFLKHCIWNNQLWRDFVKNWNHVGFFLRSSLWLGMSDIGEVRRCAFSRNPLFLPLILF